MHNLFPDNHKRRARWIELYTDIESLLPQMKEKYKHFKELNDELHDKLGLLYTEHDCAPHAELHDIWKVSELTQGAAASSTLLRISSLMMCTAAVFSSIQLFAPEAAAAVQRIGTGLFDSAWAAGIAGSAFGAEGSAVMTAGALTAGAVVTIAAAGIRAAQQMAVRNKLRKNIHHLNQIRAMKLLTLNRLDIIIRSMHYIKCELDQMQDRGDAVTRVTLQQMVMNFVEPAVTKANALQLSDAVLQLDQMDQARASWTKDDVVPTASPKPQRFFQIDQVPIQTLPLIPADLKALSLTSPDSLEPKEVYPVLRSNSCTYWPLSYADHRMGMAIVVYDSEGNLIKRWDKIGARYIVDIMANPTNQAMIFRGESNQYFSMSWSELGAM